MIPVVFTHIGNQDYVHAAIRQAQRFNERVILLGDGSNKGLGAEWYDHRNYWDDAEAFEQIYQHMSSNHFRSELFCFQIYFLARDWARDNKVKHLFLIDSDVMLYTDVSKGTPPKFAVSWCADQWQYRWSACIHNSYWTLSLLDKMCDFIVETYDDRPLMSDLREKWRWHQEKRMLGGVCDMTLLWFFIQDKRVVNQSEVSQGTVWDDNINISENYHPNEYRMFKGHKLVGKLNNEFRGYNRVLRDWVSFNALHFQGGAKKLMKDYELP